MRILFFVPSIADFNQFEKESKLGRLPKNGLEVWIYFTYLVLRDKLNKFDISITENPSAVGIIIFHKKWFPSDQRPASNQLFVCIHADYGRHRFAQVHIGQNPFQGYSLKFLFRTLIESIFRFTFSTWTASWVQPNLIPRDKHRMHLIENVFYVGNKWSLEESSLRGIEAVCAKLGLNFNCIEQPFKWHDYSQADIVLSLRSFRPNNYYHKPFAKILNGILSQSIVIAGRESASLYFKNRFFKKLPIIESIEQFEKCLTSIIENPEQFFSDTLSARAKLKNFDELIVQKKWNEIIILCLISFQRWTSASSYSRNLFLRFRRGFSGI